MSHTPGPWHVPRHAWFQVVPADGRPGDAVVAMVYECPHSHRDRAEATANARLIAAAPELLEAAKKTLEAWDSFDGGFVRQWLEDAIAKAEGKQ